jgi:hypothetical protein
MTQHESSRAVTPRSEAPATHATPSELAQAVYVALIQRGHGGTLPNPTTEAEAFATHAARLTEDAHALALAFAQHTAAPRSGTR